MPSELNAIIEVFKGRDLRYIHIDNNSALTWRKTDIRMRLRPVGKCEGVPSIFTGSGRNRRYPGNFQTFVTSQQKSYIKSATVYYLLIYGQCILTPQIERLKYNRNSTWYVKVYIMLGIHQIIQGNTTVNKKHGIK